MGAEAVRQAAAREEKVTVSLFPSGSLLKKVSPSDFVVTVSMEIESLSLQSLTSNLLLWGLTA